MQKTTSPERLAVTVRELTEADLGRGFLDALSALSDVKLTAEQARAVYAELAPNLRTYVAVWHGRVIGTTRLLVERKFIHGGGLVAHIEDVAVAKPHQQRGVASALVRHAVAEAERFGCYKVILNCFDDLVPFYERIGFRAYDRGMRLDLQPAK
jgi:glucosamine-phosphate N-acetyltransferase